MHEFLDILKYILPSLVVVGLSYFLIKAFLENNIKREAVEVSKKTKEIITPVRLQAYERIILLLERISPSSLVIRINKAGISGDQLRNLLIRSVREEYDHNVSQQLYVSPQAWELVKNAKEDIIRVINTASAKLPDGASSSELAQKVIELYVEGKYKSIDQAMAFIKKEATQLF